MVVVRGFGGLVAGFGLAMGFWIGLIWVAISIGLRWFKFQFMVLVCGGGLCNNGGEVVVMVSAIGSMGCSAFFFFGTIWV